MPKNRLPFLRMDFVLPPAAHCIINCPNGPHCVWPLCRTVPLSAAAAAVAAATSVELILPVCQRHAPLLVAPPFLPLSLSLFLSAVQVCSCKLQLTLSFGLLFLLIPCKACRKDCSCISLSQCMCVSLSLCVCDSCKCYEFWDNYL